MATHMLYNAVILYDGLNISGNSNECRLEYGARQLEEQTFGQDTIIHKPGPLTVSASAMGFWDADATNYNPDKTLFDDIGSDDKLVSIFPEAAAEGATGYSFLTSRASYNLSGEWGDLFKFSAEGNSRSRLVKATVLSNVTETSTGTGTIREVGVVEGWNEIDATNNKLDFDDGGGEENATLTSGKYATGAALATEIQTRMDALTTDNITVTYSTTTHKFTIASDGSTLELKWATGTNSATTCGDDIGFDTSADDTGSTSYVSDNVSRPKPQKLYAILHVLASSGDNSQTLDVTIESDALVGFASPTTRVTFSQVTTAVGAQYATPIATAISDEFWRAAWTIGGTGSPSFTFLVGIGMLYDIGADLT